MEEDKKEVTTYHEFSILCENMTQEEAEALAEFLAEHLDSIGVQGCVESTPKTEAEVMAED